MTGWETMSSNGGDMAELTRSTASEPPVPLACPVAEWFNPHETEAHVDPFPWYQRLRREAPVSYVPSVGMYAVSRHKEVLEILRDTATYSNTEGLGEFRPLPAVIDTPMARLDAAHRQNLIERYFPNASHQVVIFSTDTEVDRHYYQALQPHIARAYLPGG